jgi:hypothetical protein
MASADNATCTLDLNYSFIVDRPPILLVGGIDDTHALDKGASRAVYTAHRKSSMNASFFLSSLISIFEGKKEL